MTQVNIDPNAALHTVEHQIQIQIFQFVLMADVAAAPLK